MMHGISALSAVIFSITMFLTSPRISNASAGAEPPFSFLPKFDGVCTFKSDHCRSVAIAKANKHRTGYPVHRNIAHRDIAYGRAVGRFNCNSADCAGINIRHQKRAILDKNIANIKCCFRPDFESVGARNNLAIHNMYIFHRAVIAEPDGVFNTNSVIGSRNKAMHRRQIRSAGNIKSIGVGYIAVIINNKSEILTVSQFSILNDQ